MLRPRRYDDIHTDAHKHLSSRDYHSSTENDIRQEGRGNTQKNDAFTSDDKVESFAAPAPFATSTFFNPVDQPQSVNPSLSGTWTRSP